MTVTPSPVDWRDKWVYFALVDRFNNPTQPPKKPWNLPWNGFQGGTLPGVTEQLDYVRALGAGHLAVAGATECRVRRRGLPRVRHPELHR